jgi:uncharacterized protein
MKPNLTFLAITLIVVVLACASKSDSDHQLEVWKDNRLAELKSPYGWPSVVGLFELKNPVTHLGRNESNDFILPDTAPDHLGILTQTDSGIYLNISDNLDVTVEGNSVKNLRMLSDKEDNGPTMASWKSFQWHIIQREDKAYLRVKDTLSQYRSELQLIPYFPTNSDFMLNARFVAAEAEDSVTYHNVLDMTLHDPIAGYIEFDLNGASHRLTALNNDSSSYFVIFADLTTGTSTYGGGRYLYPQKADSDGFITLDFNRSINPPCVFTPYATCPLPPKENYLDIEIVAGEKMLKLY